MFSSFIVSSMTPISFLFSLSTGSFWESFASTSDSVDCFPSTKSASNPQAYHRCFLLFSPVQYKVLLPLFQFFRKLLWCCYSFLIMRVNGNLQTTTKYRRCFVLWLSHSRLNNSSLIDKIMTKAANISRCASYDVKVCQFSWNISSNWHCERVVVISSFLSHYQILLDFRTLYISINIERTINL